MLGSEGLFLDRQRASVERCSRHIRMLGSQGVLQDRQGPLMKWLGVVATARASIYFYNTEAEVRRLADGVRDVQDFFTR